MTEHMLQDRVAIITGGSRGIGREVALTYAREGCRIVLVARDEKRLREAATLIQKEAGTEALCFGVDITEKASLEAMVRAVTARFQRIDILVNAAAIVGPIGPFETCDKTEWERTISVNVLGTYEAIRSVIPAMIARKRGTIINFAGGGAFGARERFSAYSVSKAAVVRLTDAAAAELRDHGITVNGISPGQVNTAGGISSTAMARWRSFTPAGPTGKRPSAWRCTARRDICRSMDWGDSMDWSDSSTGNGLSGETLRQSNSGSSRQSPASRTRR